MVSSFLFERKKKHLKVFFFFFCTREQRKAAAPSASVAHQLCAGGGRWAPELAAACSLGLKNSPQCGFNRLRGLYWQKPSFPLLCEARVERLESGTGPPTRLLLILLISLQSSQVQRCNMTELSSVNPCVIYYCHLPAPREEVWSQLHLLFFTLRAVLSVSVKRVKLIQEKKSAGPGIFLSWCSHTAVVDLVHSQVLNVRTKEADGEVLTYKC